MIVLRTGIAILLSATALVSAQEAQKSEYVAAFSAVAVSTGGPRSEGGMSPLDIVIQRWSTQAESDKLIAALKQKGEEGMLDVLQNLQPVGRISVPGSLGYELRYAHQTPLEDGMRRIFIATDRPVSAWEARNNPRVSDYPFTFIELRVNEKGEGEGKLALATRVNASNDGKFIQLVNYTNQPIQLNEVKPRDKD